MKRLFSTVIALLLVLSMSALTAVPTFADDDAGTGTNALCTNDHNGTGSDGGDRGPGDGDLEGDPENWLGGQNSVAEPDGGSTVGDALITWMKKLLAVFSGFGG